MSIQFNHVLVVEGPILRGYYNFSSYFYLYFFVVEDPILRGYYNFQKFTNEVFRVVEDPILRGYTIQKERNLNMAIT